MVQQELAHTAFHELSRERILCCTGEHGQRHRQPNSPHPAREHSTHQDDTEPAANGLQYLTASRTPPARTVAARRRGAKLDASHRRASANSGTTQEAHAKKDAREGAKPRPQKKCGAGGLKCARLRNTREIPPPLCQVLSRNNAGVQIRSMPIYPLGRAKVLGQSGLPPRQTRGRTSHN